jgi:hypothetical protein
MWLRRLTRVLVTRARNPRGAEPGPLDPAIERLARELGLQVAVKTSLKSYPGSVHWHFKKEGSVGTLEATYWPAERRVWFSVHSNRGGAWTTHAAVTFKTRLEKGSGQ